MASEDGQATVEWVALALLVCLAAGAALVVVPAVDGRGFGGALAHRIVCAARGGCQDGDAALARAYGPRDAALVRDHAPGLVYEPGERQLPVDYARCRAPACASAPDDRDLDAHRSDAGERATVFTRVVRRGGSTYLQYWLYYPDSNTAWAGSDAIWRRNPLLRLGGRLIRGTPDYPGYHRDDWEGYEVRVDARGRAWARASSHGHWQGCKDAGCRNRWMRATRMDARVAREPRGAHPGGARPRAHLHGRGAAARAARDPRPARLPAERRRRHAALGEGGLPGARERQVLSAPAWRLPPGTVPT